MDSDYIILLENYMALEISNGSEPVNLAKVGLGDVDLDNVG